MLKPFDYNFAVDIVFCVETTSKMASIGDDVKNQIKKFINRFYDEMEECDKHVEQYRIKFILFKDFHSCDNGIIETDFYDALLNMDEIYTFIDNINFEGGCGKCNALEALALALKSKWELKWKKGRHSIVVFSQGEVNSLGLKYDYEHYPVGMPTDLAQLGAWWEGTEPIPNGTFVPRFGRLIAFVPEDEPWTEMAVWDRCCPAFFSPGGAGLDDVDIRSVIDVILFDD